MSWTTTDTTSTTDPRAIGGRHPVSIGHLVVGLALVGLVAVWALVSSGAVDGDDLQWLLPIPFVVAGAVGLTATAIGGTRRHALRPTGQAGWVSPDPPADPDGADGPAATVSNTPDTTTDSDPTTETITDTTTETEESR